MIKKKKLSQISFCASVESFGGDIEFGELRGNCQWAGWVSPQPRHIILIPLYFVFISLPIDRERTLGAFISHVFLNLFIHLWQSLIV